MCDSRNHKVPDDCWGEESKCEKCGIVTCRAEGGDDKLDLCDDCWNNLNDENNFLEGFVPSDCRKEAKAALSALIDNRIMDYIERNH